MAKKTGLGKGLEALIPGDWQKNAEKSEEGQAGVLQIPIESIQANPRQPRTYFDDAALAELADSIREHGIISPLIVISREDGDGYTLIAGERRLRAAKLAGLKEVPVIARTLSEQEGLELAIIENVQREDLDPLERARAFQALLDEFSMTHEAIAKRVGKSRVAVTNALRLLNLPENVQDGISKGQISEGHGRALLGLPNQAAIESAFQVVKNLSLNVRKTEQLVLKLNSKTPAERTVKPSDPGDRDLEDRLRQFFNTRVNLQKGAKGGNLTIYFYSDEELNRLLELLHFYD